MSNFVMSSQLSALGAGIMASAVLAAAMGNATVQEKHLAATAVHPARVYTMNQSIETGSVGGESFFYEVEHNFETEIALFYDRLLNAQKPLGDEFQRVLSQNLWDLYAE